MQQSPGLTIRGRSSEDVWDFENAFYWFSHPTRLNKALAHYDIYRTIIGLPGDIFELGVYKAASLVRLATFRNVLENDFARKIVGFDAFGKFPVENLSLKADLDFVDRFEQAGGDGLSQEEISAIFARKGFQNVELVGGDVMATLGAYIEGRPATRIALLHLDMDVKEPTAHALDLLYDRIVPNGVIVLDDYSAVAGASDAVDEFIAKHKLAIQKTSHYHVPSFIRKPS